MRNLQVLLGAADLDHYARTKLVLQQSGSGYAELIDQAQAAEQARHNAALKAAQAHEAALAAVEDAQGAALRADAAAAEQAVKTAELNALLQAAEQEMDEAEQEAARLRAQQWQARPDSKPGNGRPNVVTGPVGDCQGADTSPYGNGQAPLSALCPLWSAPGEHLRADAAYAFNMMSMEYARTFGQPICVTDSYRPLAEQVAVKIAKPYLAAKPGTSNHGWGIAVDLCGGINRFGTPQHVWMQNNAGKFAFHHPSWAQAGGSKPEAWHWEFAG
ncbi:MAG: hypothetical protein CSA58_04465 [Micrococcales bacterium]|nr:MAG: hypothetical protein CSA58_04465 [Micrococcales bacterium]